MARTHRAAGTSGANVPVVDNLDLTDAEKEELEDVERAPMEAELKHIDRKQTDTDKVYYAETVEEKGLPDTWVNKISLQVNIQHLKDLLKEAIESFPGISFATKDVAIDSPYRVLYHHYGEIQAASKKLTDDTEASQHAGLLLGFIEEKFKDTISESKNLREQGFMA